MKIRSLIYNMLTGVALFTLSACADSVSEFFGLEDRERISFTATTDEKIEELTRAAINEDSYVTAFQNTQPKKPLVLSSSVTRRDTETTRGQRIGSAEDLTAFRVSAAIASRNVSEDAFAALTPNYFYNLKAQKNSDDIFEISRDYYWPSSDDKLWFYAYAPCDDSNVLISDQTVGGPQKVSFTVATNVNNQVDLMTANAATTSFTSASGETTKTSVALNFRHELTAIRFIIGEQWLAGSIKSIGIYNVHGRGTMTIGADDATKWEWKNKAGNAVTATDDFVLTVDKGGLSGTDGEEFIEDTDLYFLMIPQSFDDNNDAYIEVKYQDNAREYTVSAPLKGQPAWVRNTTVTYAISSHELTKLKIGTISWPDATGADAWNGPKTDFAAGDEVGLYVVDPDGLTIQPHHQNVRCSYDGGSWTVHHPEDHPVYKLPDYQYFFYYPYTPTPDTTYPVAGQNTTNTTATAFFSHLIEGWRPAAVQNTSLATLNAQDLQVAKGVDDAQQSSTVNATMAHQMNLAKLKLGGTSVTDTWIYPIDNGAYTWNYQPDNRDVMASDNFSVNFPYLYSDAHYYFVFAPVETNTDTGVLLKALNNLGTATDWSWELKSLERGKLLTHTATSADVGNNVMHNNELTVAQISPLTATGSALTIPVTVTVNSTALTKGTDYTVSYKNSSNTTVTSISAAGNYTAYISPKGRYSGDAVSRPFTVNKAGKGISFANTSVVKTYGDAAFTQTVTKTGTGTVTYDSDNANVATVNGTSGQVTIHAAGTAHIIATVQDSQYDHYATNSVSYTLTVNPKSVTSPTITLGTTSYTYDGNAKQPTVSSVKDGTTTIPASEYNISYSNNTNAGTATVTISDKTGGNYTVSGTKTFTINPKTVTSPTITLASTPCTYNGNAQQPAVSSVKDGNVTIASSEYTVSYSNNVNAGTATCTITDKSGGNYTVSGSKTFTINPQALTATNFKFASATLDKTYIWEIGTSSNTLTKPSNCTVTYSSNATGVASVNSSTGKLTPGGTLNSYATITATASGNYSGTASYKIKATTKEKTFSYTGGLQSETVCPGTYQLYVWGAQGTSATGGFDGPGGKGGYATGSKSIISQTTIYICVGRQGFDYGYDNQYVGKTLAYFNSMRPYNGGGYGHAFGGGATHMASKLRGTGVLADYKNYTGEVYLVAGGGGGSETSKPGAGGAGGGISGGDGTGTYGTFTTASNGKGGTKSGGGAGGAAAGGYGAGYAGEFGLGGHSLQLNVYEKGAGGGGGWYGGGGSFALAQAGGGGSSYVGGVSNGSTTAGQRTGNGYAKIVWTGN